MKQFFRCIVIADDADDVYTADQLYAMLKEAERQGHSLEAGTYIEKMTVRQLDRLVKGRFDS